MKIVNVKSMHEMVSKTHRVLRPTAAVHASSMAKPPITLSTLAADCDIAAMTGTLTENIARLSTHLFSVPAGKSSVSKVKCAVAQPGAATEIRAALRDVELLGETRDGKKIYLFQYRRNSPVMREIGRLREMTFRRVGEGTGMRRDLDIYDTYYQHLVLWDESDLQIAGAYRIADTASIMATRGVAGLYSNSLFSLADSLVNRCERSQILELGRSFVQPCYWGMRSLDYLWFGIGAYVKRHPNIRYLLGPVSMSNLYPRPAQSLVVYFYRHYFGGPTALASARRPFVLSHQESADAQRIFSGLDYEHDFRILKAALAENAVTIPVLYRQYTETYEPGGVNFLDFNIDPHFSGCVDGLVLADLDKLKPAKRERYLGEQRNPTVLNLKAA